MKAQLRVLSGTLKGAEFVFSQQTVTIGRHPSSDVQFDPGQDLDVSGRHAELQLREGKWYVVDKESSNGTIVNGYAVTGPTKLDDTDQLRFGAEGPKVEFRLVSDTVP
ncbi:MAG: FHA domain-containing protein, partial [Gemmatimonadales bacterium]